jgi:hypothetical protein
MKFLRSPRNRYIGGDMMNSLRRYFAVVVLAIGSLTMAAPAAMAVTTPPVANEVAAAQPYVEVVPEEAAPDEPQWTYKYLIPAVVALTVLLIGGTVIMYFVKVVRGRYRVVE